MRGHSIGTLLPFRKVAVKTPLSIPTLPPQFLINFKSFDLIHEGREGCAVEKPDKRPKAKKAAKKGAKRAKRAKPAKPRKPYEEADLIRALGHELRRQILRLLHSSGKPLSPTEIEVALGLGDNRAGKLSSVSYHVAVMAGYKTIALVDEQPVRGAMEHFYVSEVSKVAWVRGVLKRTWESDEARLWPKGRGPGAKKAPAKERR
jgi:DNA-binding transcriptional ArsR family regulator